VMEKCTYCVQRIRRAQIDAKIEDRPLREGDVQTACQQACPTDAIVFGLVSNPNSRVSHRHHTLRTYAVLNDTGTRPRTRYLARIDNENEELA
jgi:Fe-S-cluster-containing dehydrogenase component